MAALVLGLAGSALGGSAAVSGALGVTAATGASLGWSLGAMLGGMIGPKQRIEGPRLQDGKVQASTHGQAIARIYGTYRTAGNIIDFSGMREHAKKESSKKAKSTVTTYSYDCDVAVGICEGEIVGVRRIWANNELIYSVAEDADLNTLAANNKAAGNIKIYTGSEAQLPDPTLEALHGAGNVPAYRGLAYIVISRMWVEKYGNRLPNFEFEVVGKGLLGMSAVRLPEADSASYPDISIGSTVFQDASQIQADASITFDGTTLAFGRKQVAPYEKIFDSSYKTGVPSISNSVEPRRLVFAADPPDPEYYEVWPFDWSDGGWSDFYKSRAAFGFHGKDGLSLAVIEYHSRLEDAGTGFLLSPESYSGNCTTFFLYDYKQNDGVWHEGSIPFTVWGCEDTSLSTPAHQRRFVGTLWLDKGFVVCHVCIPRGAPGATWPDITQLLLSAPVKFNEITRKYEVQSFKQIAENKSAVPLSHPSFFWNNVLSASGNIQRRAGEAQTANQNTECTRVGERLYRLSTEPSGKTLMYWMSLVRSEAGQSAEITGLPADLKYSGSSLVFDEVRLTETFVVDQEGVCTAYLVKSEPVNMGVGRSFKFKRVRFNINGGAATVDADWQAAVTMPYFSDWVVSSDDGILFFNVRGAYDAGGLRAWHSYAISERLTRGGALLRDIIEDVCLGVGVYPDLSAIPTQAEVRGYAVGRQVTARGAIEPLQNAHFFDAVESDNGLKFVMRGGAPVATIDEDGMQAGIDGAGDGDPAAIVRGQEVELPQQVSVGYADWNADYQTSAELVQRIATPSLNKFAVELPIAMSADEAARIADVWMYQGWSERTQLAFKVGAQHLLLEPTDVVNVVTAGRTFRARITSKTDDRGVIDLGAVVDGGRYSSSATGSSKLGSQTDIAALSPSNAFYINSPIVTDADDGAGFYAALWADAILSSAMRWGGATLLVNEGGASDVQHTVGSVAAPPAAIAQVQLAVPAPSSPRANIADQSYAILVRTNVALHSITRQQLFNGGNLFAVVYGKTATAVELLQFQFAEEVAEHEYKLSGLLRGRFGTESGGHLALPAGAFLVQLNPRDGLLRVPATPAQIGQAFLYKAVTNGQAIEDAPSTSFATNARGLRPYSPVHLNAVKVGDDWHLRWTRRSRLDGGWREAVDVPLGEAVEQYEIKIFAGRTVRVGAQSFVYTLAMQVEDFSSAQSSIKFLVAQVSAVVGVGEFASWE